MWLDKVKINDLLEEAIDLALEAQKKGEVPVGAIVVGQNGQVISKAHNSCIALKDPTAHAEILAIREACFKLSNYRLTDALIVCTLEPCWMCFGAIMNARIGGLIYSLEDPDLGAISTAKGIRIKGWRPPLIMKGIGRDRYLKIIKGFFELRRCSSRGEVPKRS